MPASDNPTLDTTGENCLNRQSGLVYFLAGQGTFEPVTRSCTIPFGKILFFPLINAECSNREAPPFFGETDAELRRCARLLIDDVGVGTLRATIDGQNVQGLQNFRVQSPAFNFRMPAQDNILLLPGVTSGRAASDGYWLAVKPLSPGRHVIHFEASVVRGPFAGATQNVTYNLNVQRGH
jgi:hypothetical protein